MWSDDYHYHLHRTRRADFVRLAIATLIALLVAPAFSTSAQVDLIDPGENSISPVETLYRIGYYFQMCGHHDRAIEAFTEAIEMVPEWGNLYAARGDSYAALGAHNLAIADYSRAIELFPDFVSALVARGQAYFALGEFALAQADYENAQAQMPAYAQPYHGLGDLFFLQGQWSAALGAYESYLAWITEPPNNSAPDTTIIERMGSLYALVQASGA